MWVFKKPEQKNQRTEADKHSQVNETFGSDWCNQPRLEPYNVDILSVESKQLNDNKEIEIESPARCNREKRGTRDLQQTPDDGGEIRILVVTWTKRDQYQGKMLYEKHTSSNIQKQIELLRVLDS